jgi:hypothetical protein
MALDLETLRTEMLAYLRNSGIPVFHAAHRGFDPLKQVHWDVDNHPDYRAFLAVAKQAGAKLIHFFHHTLSGAQIDMALEELEETDLTREEKRNYEKRLRKIRDYEGFTSAIELSFSVENMFYVFELETEWYTSLTEILAEIDAMSEDEDDEVGGDSLGGYFSNN